MLPLFGISSETEVSLTLVYTLSQVNYMYIPLYMYNSGMIHVHIGRKIYMCIIVHNDVQVYSIMHFIIIWITGSWLQFKKE